MTTLKQLSAKIQRDYWKARFEHERMKRAKILQKMMDLEMEKNDLKEKLENVKSNFRKTFKV